ncbi:hypothetical protein COV17_00100 [Candidatus Woesearchaeota archaeon CG10_big_fil_rev_8_21_14_0_10_36_11]|nr:MAG: hypothetical protein COV17_00100 [Candidatus Woesearchaeota archaeon CG10_big_fil_rev_8_21_14_0_10_36_11]
MNVNRFALGDLEETLRRDLQSYHEQYATLSAVFPQVDIPFIFGLWDEYLTFLDEHKEEEQEARRKRTERRGEELPFVGMYGGFDNDDQYSSGMGLWGVQYLLHEMGGKILYGEDFKTGGPLFTCILPKKLPAGKVGKTISNLATRLNAAPFYHRGSSLRQK